MDLQNALDTTYLNWQDFRKFSIACTEAARSSCEPLRALLKEGKYVVACTHCKKMTRLIPSADWNLRNSMVCASCGLSGRERHILEVINRVTKLKGIKAQEIACFEKVTHFAGLLEKLYPGLKQSEYISSTLPPGSLGPAGENAEQTRHEDIQRTSYASDSLGLIIHRDVYEHIPSPAQALR